MKQSRAVSFERGRKPWLWILTVLVLSLVLLGGFGGGSNAGNKNPGPNPSPFGVAPLQGGPFLPFFKRELV